MKGESTVIALVVIGIFLIALTMTPGLFGDLFRLITGSMTEVAQAAGDIGQNIGDADILPPVR